MSYSASFPCPPLRPLAGCECGESGGAGVGFLRNTGERAPAVVPDGGLGGWMGQPYSSPGLQASKHPPPWPPVPCTPQSLSNTRPGPFTVPRQQVTPTPGRPVGWCFGFECSSLGRCRCQSASWVFWSAPPLVPGPGAFLFRRPPILSAAPWRWCVSMGLAFHRLCPLHVPPVAGLGVRTRRAQCPCSRTGALPTEKTGPRTGAPPHRPGPADRQPRRGKAASVKHRPADRILRPQTAGGPSFLTNSPWPQGLPRLRALPLPLLHRRPRNCGQGPPPGPPQAAPAGGLQYLADRWSANVTFFRFLTT